MKSPANKQAAFFAGIFSISMIALSWSPLVHGASPDEAPSRHVRFADLNIDSASGAEALYARIRSAARAVCVQYESPQLNRRPVWQTCVSKSVDAAVATINNRMLSAVHNGASTKSPVG